MKYTKEEIKNKIAIAEPMQAILMLEELNIFLSEEKAIIQKWQDYGDYLVENKKKFGDDGEKSYDEYWEEVWSMNGVGMKILKTVDNI